MRGLQSILLLGAFGLGACSQNPPPNDPSNAQTAQTTPAAKSEVLMNSNGNSPGVNDPNYGRTPSANQTQTGSNPPITSPDSKAYDTTGSAARPNTSPQNQSATGGGPAPLPSNDTAATAPAPSGPSRPDADNTRVNNRDRNNSGSLTPLDQGGSESDRNITQQIRQAVTKDGGLSFTAKNVKIITVGGKVTLRGPVKTDQERASIEAAAKRVAGDAQVDNQIEVKK